MQTEQNKLVNFERIVLNDAMDTKKSVTERLKAEHDNAVNAAKDEIKAAVERRYAKEMDSIVRKNNELLVKHSTDLRQQLITRRGEIIDKLFIGVVERLNEYVSTPAYKEYMQKAIESAANELGGGNLMLILNDRDKLLDLDTNGYTVEYSTEDIVGGFVMINKDSDILVDETFKLKLKRQRANFLDLCRVRL